VQEAKLNDDASIEDDIIDFRSRGRQALSPDSSQQDSTPLRCAAVKRGEGGKCGAEGTVGDATVEMELSNMTSNSM